MHALVFGSAHLSWLVAVVTIMTMTHVQGLVQLALLQVLALAIHALVRRQPCLMAVIHDSDVVQTRAPTIPAATTETAVPVELSLAVLALAAGRVQDV